MGKIPLLLVVSISLILGACESNNDRTPTVQNQLNRAVEGVRLALETTINKTVPSLSVLIKTPDASYFTSSVAHGVEPVTPDTYFRFASNTKNFTATAILNMNQNGWLDYTDRIVDNIPGSNIPYVPTTESWNIPYKDQITIEQLLQHNAGVYDVDNDPVPGCNGMGYVQYKLEQDPNHQFSAAELVEQNVIHNLSYFAPGTVNYHYSNTGFTILSEIIARVYTYQSGSNKTYGDYLRDYIYGDTAPVPLMINFPSLAGDNRLPMPFVCGTIYTAPNGETNLNCTNNMSAHVAEGNGYGTMNELTTYIRSLIKGENVLSPESVELMITDTSPGDTGYSLGCLHAENLGVGHNGAIHGYMSLMVYDTEFDVSVIVLMPMWDESNGIPSFLKCLKTLNCAGWAAREALGYPGKPEGSTGPGD
ncbi:MAG: serine hydrolase domain-containing protein [bacterium]